MESPVSWARVNEVKVWTDVESPSPHVAVTSDCTATADGSLSEDARASQRDRIDSTVADDGPVGASPKAK